MVQPTTRGSVAQSEPAQLSLFVLDPLLEVGSPGLVSRLVAAEPRRFALERLEALCGDPPAVVLAARLGVSRKRLDRVRRRGGLTVFEADELAVRAGYHPAAVWPDWSEEVPSLCARVGGRRAVAGVDPGRLRALRVRSGASVGMLAAAAGVSRKHLTRLELGQARPGPEVLARLAGALGVAASDLQRAAVAR